MIRRPPRSTLDRSSAASDVYKRQAENLAIARAKQLFGADYANVQPHSGSQANAAVYLALLKPGDTILGMSPVSYTHLRAHETVLDIVCRLLLETTKNYNTKLHHT